MSNHDKIYFSRGEYNKLMQIINDNLKCKDDDIKYIATRLKEKNEKYYRNGFADVIELLMI